MEKIDAFLKKVTQMENKQEFDYFKEILLDLLRVDYPQTKLSQQEIDRRAEQATKLLERDDITTTECIENAMNILEKDLAASSYYVS